MAEISTPEDLLTLENSFAARNAECIWDYLGSKDFCNDAGIPYDKRGDRQSHVHPKNKLSKVFVACIHAIPDNQKVYPILLLAQKCDEIVQNKLKALLNYGTIYININGGYMPLCSTFSIKERVESKVFPQNALNEIKVSKWPEGKHYYPTINGQSIIVNGVNKWDTEQEAMDNAKAWLGSK
jgi:hypothetical protein